MADQLQFRGGTTAESDTFTGASKELTVDTDKNTLVVHDGSTAGGHPLVKESDVGTIAAQDADNANITGGVIQGVSGSFNFDSGSAVSPSITFDGDTNTGLFSPAADTLTATTNGSERMRIDSSGNVGIGTSSPSAQLQVNGRVNIGGSFFFTFAPSGSGNRLNIPITKNSGINRQQSFQIMVNDRTFNGNPDFGAVYIGMKNLTTVNVLQVFNMGGTITNVTEDNSGTDAILQIEFSTGLGSAFATVMGNFRDINRVRFDDAFMDTI